MAPKPPRPVKRGHRLAIMLQCACFSQVLLQGQLVRRGVCPQHTHSHQPSRNMVSGHCRRALNQLEELGPGPVLCSSSLQSCKFCHKGSSSCETIAQKALKSHSHPTGMVSGHCRRTLNHLEELGPGPMLCSSSLQSGLGRRRPFTVRPKSGRKADFRPGRPISGP